MTNINPNASTLLTQIQAQLQAGQDRARTSANQTTIPQRTFPLPDADDGDEITGAGQERRNRLLAPSTPDIEDLSSSEELEDAQRAWHPSTVISGSTNRTHLCPGHGSTGYTAWSGR